MKLKINFRAHQLAAYQARKRFAFSLWHRRAGKTFASVGELLADAISTNRDDWRGYYIAPTRVQAKLIVWTVLKQFVADLPGMEFNEAELRLDIPGGSRIQLLGAENYHRLRGLYIDSAVVDEAALVPSPAWTQVISPALADRLGRAKFIGTPMGRMNLLHEVHEEALNDPENWSHSVLRYSDTNVIRPEEIVRLKRAMSEAEFNQEFNVSWDAAMRGAFWSKEIEAARAEGRVGMVRYDNTLPVYAAVDLGWADTMVVVFKQMAGTEDRYIDCRAFELTSIPDMLASWRHGEDKLPFPVDHIVLPHDAKVHELGSGKTRQEVFTSMGYDTSICPDVGLLEGIEQTRQALRHAWFDAERCKVLLEAMAHFRSEYDEVRRVHRMTPLHDWTSHYAAAVRYGTIGRPAALGGYKPNSRGYRRLGRLGG